MVRHSGWRPVWDARWGRGCDSEDRFERHQPIKLTKKTFKTKCKMRQMFQSHFLFRLTTVVIQSNLNASKNASPIQAQKQNKSEKL